MCGCGCLGKQGPPDRTAYHTSSLCTASLCLFVCFCESVCVYVCVHVCMRLCACVSRVKSPVKDIGSTYPLNIAFSSNKHPLRGQTCANTRSKKPTNTNTHTLPRQPELMLRAGWRRGSAAVCTRMLACDSDNEGMSPDTGGPGVPPPRGLRTDVSFDLRCITCEELWRRVNAGSHIVWLS